MNLQVFENIECYVEGCLTAVQLRCFEDIVKKDDIVSVRFELYCTIESEMKSYRKNEERELELRKSLSNLGKKYFKADTAAVSQRPQDLGRNWMFATAAILVIIIFFYEFLTIQNKSTSALYAQYMQVPDLFSRKGNEDNDLLSKAIIAYNNKDFNKALENFDKYLSADSSDGQLLLARNICLTETGQIEKSITCFEILAKEKKKFKCEASWYMALDYLIQNDKDSCKKILEGIPATSEFYFKARSLFAKL